MKRLTVAALAALMASGSVLAAGPFDPIRGKMKEGMYEYKMDMDMGQMPGMPPPGQMPGMPPPGQMPGMPPPAEPVGEPN